MTNSSQTDIERLPQQGTKEHAGSTPETVRVYTRDATGTRYVTHLSRWDDEPLTVDKRVKKTGRMGHGETKTVSPDITETVAEALESAGFDFED